MNTVNLRPALTPRQQGILPLLARGLGNQDIAEALGISTNTVKVHLVSLFKTLGVGNRTEAVLQAQRHFPTILQASDPHSPVRCAIAIFPFEGQDALRNIAEDIAQKVSSWNWLPVVSYEAATQWRSQVGNPQQIRQELCCRYMLTGSIRTTQEHAYVVLRLVSTTLGHTEWSQSFEASRSDTGPGGPLSLRIVCALMPELLKAEFTQNPIPLNPDSRSATLRGLHLLQRHRASDYTEARTWFYKALEQNPTYALAHYGMAHAIYHSILEYWEPNNPSIHRELHSHTSCALHHDPLNAF